MIPWRERVIAAAVGLALLILLGVGAALTPAARGHGTHEQLGLPACGFYVATGYPCPTCGMTTAVSSAVHGEPLRAVRTQPMGALVALLASVGFWGCVHVAATGSRLGRVVGRLLTPRVLWTAVAVWGASWGYTILTWGA